MMESSEKRKERLKAMRVEAAQAASSGNPGALPGLSSLANPFAEAPGPHSWQEQAQAAPRFDYYTDPTAAFSSNRRNNSVNQTQQSHPNPNPFPHLRSPILPFSGAQNVETSAYPQAYDYRWRGSCSSNQMIYQQRTPPPTNAPGEGYFPDPSFQKSGPRSFGSRQGSPHWHRNSPRPASPNFGRGRGQFAHRGRSHGKWQGFHGRGSGLGRPAGPEQFFHPSMLEDPWKGMFAVTWTPARSHSTSSWMPCRLAQRNHR